MSGVLFERSAGEDAVGMVQVGEADGGQSLLCWSWSDSGQPSQVDDGEQYGPVSLPRGVFEELDVLAVSV